LVCPWAYRLQVNSLSRVSDVHFKLLQKKQECFSVCYMWGQVKKVVKEKQMRGARDLKDFGKETRRKLEGKFRRICDYVQKKCA
jgi:hypothetical protein